jgi:hypothetical protein
MSIWNAVMKRWSGLKSALNVALRDWPLGFTAVAMQELCQSLTP